MSKARFCWALSNVLGKVDEDGYVTVPSGTYTLNDSMGEYTALPGHIQDFTLVDSWYYYREDISSITEYAPVVAGWVEITEKADRTITVAFDVYDDLNNNIKGSWTSSSTINAKASASKASHTQTSSPPA